MKTPLYTSITPGADAVEAKEGCTTVIAAKAAAVAARHAFLEIPILWLFCLVAHRAAASFEPDYMCRKM
jgi:hypothetical protein